MVWNLSALWDIPCTATVHMVLVKACPPSCGSVLTALCNLYQAQALCTQHADHHTPERSHKTCPQQGCRCTNMLCTVPFGANCDVSTHAVPPPCLRLATVCKASHLVSQPLYTPPGEAPVPPQGRCKSRHQLACGGAPSSAQHCSYMATRLDNGEGGSDDPGAFARRGQRAPVPAQGRPANRDP